MFRFVFKRFVHVIGTIYRDYSMASGGTDEDLSDDLPSAAVCQQRCEEFARIGGTDEALAMYYLQDRKWDVQVSNFKCTIFNLEG